MKKVLLIATLLPLSTFAADLDLEKLRTCVVAETTTAAELYHPGEIVKGLYARVYGRDKISFANLIRDDFIYFEQKPSGPVDRKKPYVWRYSEGAELSINAANYSVYHAGSFGGPLLLIFHKDPDAIHVAYVRIKGGKTLVSLRCEP